MRKDRSKGSEKTTLKIYLKRLTKTKEHQTGMSKGSNKLPIFNFMLFTFYLYFEIIFYRTTIYMIKNSIKMKTREKLVSQWKSSVDYLVRIVSPPKSILYIKNEKRTRRGKPLTLEMPALVSETEPHAEISAAPMSKLSRLRTNFLEDKMA